MLQSPVFPAVNATSFEKASTFTVTPDIAPGIEESFDIMILNGGAQVVYEDIDLTHVTAIDFGYTVVSPFMAGGNLKLAIDDPSNEVGEAELLVATEEGEAQKVRINIASNPGRHTLYILADGALVRPVGALTNLEFIAGSIVQ